MCFPVYAHDDGEECDGTCGYDDEYEKEEWEPVFYFQSYFDFEEIMTTRDSDAIPPWMYEGFDGLYVPIGYDIQDICPGFENSNGGLSVYDDIFTVNGITYKFGISAESEGKYTGWHKTEKGRRYYSDGKYVTGKQNIDGKTYSFDKNGYLIK